MFYMYGKVATTAARNAVRAWPAALSLVVYALILYPALLLTQPMGIVGGLLLALVAAACWSSYIELISQAVAGAAIRVRWDELKATFGARFWDVISVMFAFWILGYAIGAVLGAVGQGAPQVNPAAVSAIFGIAMAFFFNAVPELLYQGNTRSFSLLMSSARFMLANPVAWLLPNLVFAAAAMAAGGGLHFQRPAEVLLAFGNTFSSPLGVLGLFVGMPRWSLPLVLFAVHYVMIFRGVLFRELSGGGGNARLRAFQAHMRR
jgi:hypothetical protein